MFEVAKISIGAGAELGAGVDAKTYRLRSPNFETSNLPLSASKFIKLRCKCFDEYKTYKINI